ncbi:MAG: hypothetical protein Aurels2KO_14000 [Aureliella sp.]
MRKSADYMTLRIVALALSLLASMKIAVARDPLPPSQASEAIMEVLDLNGDQQIAPYEAAIAISAILCDENGQQKPPLGRKQLHNWIRDTRSDLKAEVQELSTEFLGTYEEDDEAAFMDIDGDGKVTTTELRRYLMFGDLMTDRSFINEEVDAWFEDDRNGDGALTASELGEEADLLVTADFNRDGRLTKDELTLDVRANYFEVEFNVTGDRAEMVGTIGTLAPARLIEVIVEHPEVRTIVMRNVPGSIDDLACFEVMRLVHKHGFIVHVPKGGVISSGGVDVYLAAKQRTAHEDSLIGIHAWGDLDGSGSDASRDKEEHADFLKVFAEVGIPADFYWYSMKVASPDEMHWMTPAERKRFKINP